MLQNLKSCFSMLLGAGAIQVANQVAPMVDLPVALAALGGVALKPVLDVSADLLGNLASAKLEGSSRNEYAERNHHLRAGMAGALRKALVRTRAELHLDVKDAALSARFDTWDANLAQAEDRSILDRLIPELLEDELYDASSGAPTKEQSVEALATLLQQWLTTDPAQAATFSREQAIAVASEVLPRYFDAFKQAAINDTTSHLFQAFTVNGINRLLQRVNELPKVIAREHEATRAFFSSELTRIVSPELPSAAMPQDWRQPPVFLGREEQLRQMERLLTGPEAGSVGVSSVQGLPGVGKSALCEQFAFSFRHHFPGGYARLTLQESVTSEQIVQEIAGRFGVKGETAQLPGLLQSRLRTPRSLLHIENVDSDPIGRAVAEVSRRLPNCAILISGRRRELGRAQGWGQVAVEPFGREEAFALLASEVEREPASSDERSAWDRLMERCGYLPLAIHLSAGQIRSGLTVEEILPELLEVEPVDPADPLFEQQARACLRTSFDLSWKIYKQQCEEKKHPEWIDALCAFAAAPLSGVGSSLGAAIANLDETSFKRAIALAVNLSLAVRDDGSHTSWRLHPLIRDFVAEQKPEAQQGAAERQSQWFLQRIGHQDGQEASIDRDEPLSWREVRLEETALSQWLAGLDASGARAALAVGHLYARYRGSWREWHQTAERALSLEMPFDDWAWSCWISIYTATHLGQADRAEARATELRERAQEAGEGHWVVLALRHTAELLSRRGRMREALELYRAIVFMFERLGDRRAALLTQNHVARILIELGQQEEALTLLQSQMEEMQSVCGPRALYMPRGLMAEILIGQGQLDEALALSRQQIQDCKQHGEAREVIIAEGRYAKILILQGQYDEALSILRDGLVALEKMGDLHEVLTFEGRIARIHWQRSEYDIALAMLDKLATRWRELGDELHYAVTRDEMAEILISQGQLDQAMQVSEDALAARQRVSDHRGAVTTQARLAILAARLGDLHGADARLRKVVIPGLVEHNDTESLVAARRGWAVIKWRLGQQREAVKLLQLALRDAEAHKLPIAAEIRKELGAQIRL